MQNTSKSENRGGAAWDEPRSREDRSTQSRKPIHTPSLSPHQTETRNRPWEMHGPRETALGHPATQATKEKTNPAQRLLSQSISTTGITVGS